MEDKFNVMQSQIQSMIAALSGLKNQNQLNQTAQLLYNSGILNSIITKGHDQ